MSARVEDFTPDLVVVGGGPRALYALADLESELQRIAPTAPSRERLRVMVLEPTVAGAGAVWDPRQPEHLLMNVDARILDATCPSVPDAWVRGSGHEDAPAVHPPRAHAGRYLAQSFERLTHSPLLDVRHRAIRVTVVRRDAGAWVCETCSAAGEPREPYRAQRVLLTTGHAGGTGVDHQRIADASQGPDPGSHVVMRGAALTAFDVVLDLTAARGGQWVADANAESGLVYRGSGAEPASITLVARSREPMLPKPVEVPSILAGAVRERTSRLRPGAAPDDAWWEVMADAAAAAAHASGITVERDALMRRLDGVPDEEPAHRWARDVRRAQGDVDADPAWWWGRAWAAAYAEVVRSLERAPREKATWPRWRTRAAALERWAFGPPLETHRRLLALHEAGRLRVVARADQEPGSDGAVIIDAFTRGPGVLDAPRPWDPHEPWLPHGREPWDGLLAAGEATVRSGERGAHTLPDGTCVRPDGSPSAGLFALGRPTEDPVIGHDSLQRRLHGDSGRWAAAVARSWSRGSDIDTVSQEPAHG